MRIFSFFLTYLGAFTIWILRGRKTDLEKELSGRMDGDARYYRNFVTGLVIVCLVIMFGLLLEKVLGRKF